MTPEQALKILEDATGRLTLTRGDHLTIANALETLNKLIQETKEKKNGD